MPLWEQQARQWSRVKPPLRPSGEDLVWAQETVDAWQRSQQRPPRVLVLGATAELASLRWPEHCEVTGLDLSQPMLRGVWMAAPVVSGHRQAVQGNWLSMPFRDDSFDLIFGDGSFSLLQQNESLPLTRELRRVLRPDGVLALRAYVRPERSETPEAVCEQLLAGRIGNFHIFKFRLLMALQRGNGEVRVVDAWKFFHTKCPPAETIAHQLGWAVDEVTTIESYRGQNAIYWFPTLTEFRAVLSGEFIEQTCLWPSYELGDRCPTVVFVPGG